MPTSPIRDVIVLGAGAAGLMCAIEAGRRGRSVLLIDHAEKVGKKILISGGGRCNFTNLDCQPENFLSENLHFAKSALARYTSADFVTLVQQHGIPFHEKTLGQLFCDRSAQDIVTMLERECVEAKVKTLLGTKIVSVTHDADFRVETSAGVFHAKSVVVAMGGLSIPKMGATGMGYSIAEQFGLRIVPCRPALVPFTFSAEECDRWCDLAGLSAEVIATSLARGPRKARTVIPAFREKLLITHRGVSGPAVLQVSSYWRPGEAVEFDLAPGVEVTKDLLAHNAPRDFNAAFQALRTIFAGRLAERWLDVYPPPDWTNAGLATFEDRLHNWTVVPAGTEGYAKAEVTAGGVDTAELDAKTMEAKKVPGLYFIGEVVDVTGWLGGYNFQWAWASGASAGRNA